MHGGALAGSNHLVTAVLEVFLRGLQVPRRLVEDLHHLVADINLVLVGSGRGVEPALGLLVSGGAIVGHSLGKSDRGV